MEEDKRYFDNLKVGIILTFIAFLFPLIFTIYDNELGQVIFFWGFAIKDSSLRFYLSPFGLNLILALSILACIIINYYILRSIDKVIHNTRKLAGESFTVGVLMILSTLNLTIIIEYGFITNYPGAYFWKPPSLWSFYFPGVGMIGMFFGSFIIIFSSIREMKKYESPYYKLALLITLIILLVWIIYYFYLFIFTFLSVFILLFFLIRYLSHLKRRLL